MAEPRMSERFRRWMYTKSNGDLLPHLKYDGLGFSKTLTARLRRAAHGFVRPNQVESVGFAVGLLLIVPLAVSGAPPIAITWIIMATVGLVLIFGVLLHAILAKSVIKYEYFIFQSLVHAIAMIDEHKSNWSGVDKKDVIFQLTYVGDRMKRYPRFLGQRSVPVQTERAQQVAGGFYELRTEVANSTRATLDGIRSDLVARLTLLAEGAWMELPLGDQQVSKYRQVVDRGLRATSAIALLLVTVGITQFFDSGPAKTILAMLIGIACLAGALVIIFGEPLKLASFRKMVDWLTGLVGKLKSSADAGTGGE